MKATIVGGIGEAFMWLAVIAAAPFAMLGLYCMQWADDIEDKQRRRRVTR